MDFESDASEIRKARGEEGKPPTAMLALQCYRCCCRNEQSGQQQHPRSRAESRTGLARGHPRAEYKTRFESGRHGRCSWDWGRTLEGLVFCWFCSLSTPQCVWVDKIKLSYFSEKKKVKIMLSQRRSNGYQYMLLLVASIGPCVSIAEALG
jgi:hypothetical protein